MTMQYNKYHDLCVSLTAQQNALRQRIDELMRTQDWYNKFNATSAITAVESAKTLLLDYNNELRELQPRVIDVESKVARLKAKASLGWNPKYWFSQERTAIKSTLNSEGVELLKLRTRTDLLQTQSRMQVTIIERFDGELKKYKAHDEYQSKAKITSLHNESANLVTSLRETTQLRDILNAELSAPLAELAKLNTQKTSIASKLQCARALDLELSHASNSYEKAMVHEKSKQTFGESSPRKVIVSHEREVDSIDRNISKLHVRLESIAQKSSRVIRRLIIDGNNLCYQKSPKKFLGLSALRPVANLLSDKYKVLIVFDASIREQLRKGDRQIEECFVVVK